MVPPQEIILLTLRDVMGINSPLINPSYPRSTPTTSIPSKTAFLTTLLIAAFIPGASPPEVKTPIFLILFFIVLLFSRPYTLVIYISNFIITHQRTNHQQANTLIPIMLRLIRPLYRNADIIRLFAGKRCQFYAYFR